MVARDSFLTPHPQESATVKRIVALSGVVWLFLTVSPARAQEKRPADEVQRLANVCKVWGAVRYLHPYVACKDIDWDAALVKALPKIRAAGSADEYAAAVQGMLDALQDPVTRIMPTATSAKGPGLPPGDKEIARWIDKDKGILAVDLRDTRTLATLARDAKAAGALRDEIKQARAVILDCRVPAMVSDWVWRSQRFYDLLQSREIPGLGRRYVVHSGYRAQLLYRDTGSGGYASALQTTFVDSYKAPAGQDRKSVFLLNAQSNVPEIALALQLAGDSFLVVQGKASEAFGVTPNLFLPLADGWEVGVRTAELLTPQGGIYRFEADAEVPADADAGPDGPAFKAALALLQDPKQSKRDKSRAAVPPPPASDRPDRNYSDKKYPDWEYRLLALYRFWTVIHYFYPYKHLMDRDWDGVLTEFLPRFLAAKDLREYTLTVAEMSTHVPDSHTWVISSDMAQFLGVAPPPLGLRWIEDAAVVTELRDEQIARDKGLQLGDVVVKVDGEPVDKRMALLGKYLAASTPQGHKAYILLYLLNGPDKSVCKLTVRGVDGKTRDVELPRRREYWSSTTPHKHEVFEILPGNVGYVDLTRLLPAQVDAMLEKLKGTKAIVFDLRGYPKGVIWTLAPRLNIKKARYAASFQRPLVSGAETDGNYFAMASIYSTDRWIYKGQTVTLIDERAISQSEHTGLFLEAACDTKFIGSHTQGANGDVTDLVLPGGISVVFGGHDVRHADGRQLQRIGLVPHIEIRPTIKGIREGKDEVLDRALTFLETGK
jgi:C-terminal processing protease CtpA/Prc